MTTPELALALVVVVAPFDPTVLVLADVAPPAPVDASLPPQAVSATRKKRNRAIQRRYHSEVRSIATRRTEKVQTELKKASLPVMREIHWLSHTLAVALGIPALSFAGLSCGSASPAPEHPEKPVVRRPDPTDVVVTAQECKEPGSVCSYDDAGCGPDASDQAQKIYTGKLRGKDWMPDDPSTLANLHFDAAKTKAARTESFPGQDPLLFCCYSGCPKYDEAAIDRAEPTPPTDIIHCVPVPERTAFPAASEARCPASLKIEGHYRPFSTMSGAENCCYETGRSRGNLGRPLREDGAVTDVASTESRSTSTATAIDLGRFTAEERAQGARTWHRAALLEHASVAAFAKVSLELLAFGAPPDLVKAAHEAAIDEIAHASLCTEIAAAFGASSRPGPHPAAARVRPTTDLASFVLETIEDGCIGETIAALEAKRAARESSDPFIARAYEKIAEDEARHAALAWRIVAWAITVDGAQRETMQATLADAERRGNHVDVLRLLVRPCAATCA